MKAFVIPVIVSILILGGLGFFQEAEAASFTAVQNGNWNDPNTWLGGEVPGDADDKTIPSGIIVTIPIGYTINNGGTINNAGEISGGGQFVTHTLDNSGNITNNLGGILEVRGMDNSGTINNFGVINIKSSPLGFTNNGGTINNNVGGTINNDHTINNDGTINNSGTINNKLGERFNNYDILNNDEFGIINNFGFFDNSIAINDSPTINNSGTINNSSFLTNFGGTINNNSGGTINNDGTIINSASSTINNNIGGNIFNSGTIDNNVGATINSFNIVSNTVPLTFGIFDIDDGIILSRAGGIINTDPTAETLICGEGTSDNGNGECDPDVTQDDLDICAGNLITANSDLSACVGDLDTAETDLATAEADLLTAETLIETLQALIDNISVVFVQPILDAVLDIPAISDDASLTRTLERSLSTLERADGVACKGAASFEADVNALLDDNTISQTEADTLLERSGALLANCTP